MLSMKRFATAFVILSERSSFHTTALSMSPKFNFGAASSKTPLLFGVEAPGVPMKPGGSYNTPKSVPKQTVDEWASYLEENNVKRTLCLLKPEELECYEDPGYEALLQEKGMTPSLVDVFEAGASEKVMEAYRNAVDAGERIAVHCSGGEGRTGVVLGAILVKEGGLSAEEAEKEVMEAAEKGGVNRKLGVAKVNKLLDKGTLA